MVVGGKKGCIEDVQLARAANLRELKRPSKPKFYSAIGESTSKPSATAQQSVIGSCHIILKDSDD
jgi:hypothetical protein